MGTGNHWILNVLTRSNISWNKCKVPYPLSHHTPPHHNATAPMLYCRYHKSVEILFSNFTVNTYTLPSLWYRKTLMSLLHRRTFYHMSLLHLKIETMFPVVCGEHWLVMNHATIEACFTQLPLYCGRGQINTIACRKWCSKFWKSLVTIWP